VPSRRRRKRHRRQAQAGRGDRLGAPESPGPEGSCGLWRGAPPRELRLLLSAIRQGWPVPFDRRGPILDEIFDGLDEADGRRVALVGRIVITAAQASLEP
jgi:hypothetical protein